MAAYVNNGEITQCSGIGRREGDNVSGINNGVKWQTTVSSVNVWFLGGGWGRREGVVCGGKFPQWRRLYYWYNIVSGS